MADDLGPGPENRGCKAGLLRILGLLGQHALQQRIAHRGDLEALAETGRGELRITRVGSTLVTRARAVHASRWGRRRPICEAAPADSRFFGLRRLWGDEGEKFADRRCPKCLRLAPTHGR